MVWLPMGPYTPCPEPLTAKEKAEIGQSIVHFSSSNIRAGADEPMGEKWTQTEEDGFDVYAGRLEALTREIAADVGLEFAKPEFEQSTPNRVRLLRVLADRAARIREAVGEAKG